MSRFGGRCDNQLWRFFRFPHNCGLHWRSVQRCWGLEGTLSFNGSSSNIAGVINTQGQAVFFDDSPINVDPASGSVTVLPTITGACSFSGAVTAYLAPPPGGTSTGSSQGNVNSATSISATATVASRTGTFTLSSFSPLTGSVAALSGSQVGAIEGAAPSLVPLTFTPASGSNNMSFTNDPLSSCTLSGTFTQEGTSNVFDVSITFSGVAQGCPAVGTVKGLGFESGTDYFNINNGAAGTYLYAVSSTSAFVLEVFQ